MNLELSNEEYNFIRMRMKRLEETYKQTIDPTIRIAVKDRTCYEILENVPVFYEIFGEKLENCQMSSLKEITDVTDYIMNSLTVIKLEEIDIQTAKKVLKLKQKQLLLFVKAYNEAVKNENLTYFSKQIDNKFIMLACSDGEYYGTVSTMPKNSKYKKSLCCFCNNFRNGDEITFVTNSLRKDNDEYSSIGQYCCSDYQKCNKDIVDSQKLIRFLSYNKKMVNQNNKE